MINSLAQYGHTFVAWTQYSIVNTGKNTCRMVCSVEAEFPNGVSWFRGSHLALNFIILYLSL